MNNPITLGPINDPPDTPPADLSVDEVEATSTIVDECRIWKFRPISIRDTTLKALRDGGGTLVLWLEGGYFGKPKVPGGFFSRDVTSWSVKTAATAGDAVGRGYILFTLAGAQAMVKIYPSIQRAEAAE